MFTLTFFLYICLCRHKKEHGDSADIKSIEERIASKYGLIKEVESGLPKPNGFYLNIVLGSINVNLLDRKLRLDYKEQYERFKLFVTSVLLVTSFVNLFAEFRYVK